MSRFPMAKTIADILANRECITIGDGNGHAEVVSKSLTHMAEIARETARILGGLRQHEDDRDDLMARDLDELARQVMCIPWWLVYPELSYQVDGVMRDSFDDEHFRLEDPEGWAEISEDLPTRVLH